MMEDLKDLTIFEQAVSFIGICSDLWTEHGHDGNNLLQVLILCEMTIEALRTFPGEVREETLSSLVSLAADEMTRTGILEATD